MKKFQKKKKSFFHTKIALFLMSILLCFMVFSVFRFGSRFLEVKEDKKILIKKIEDMENRKERLEKEVTELNTEEGKEKVFRENLGLAKEGEEVIVVVEEEKIEMMEKEEKDGFIQKIKSFFMKDN